MLSELKKRTQMKKNRLLNNLRLSQETDKLLSELSEQLELSKSALSRMLINRGLKQLRSDIIKAGGIDKLIFEIKPSEI